MADSPVPGQPPRAVVIGAGIIGMCCALALQRTGHAVTVLDPRPPGSFCSFGNAGQVSPFWATPLGLPGLMPRVPGMLADPLAPLALRWRDLPTLAPWLARFVAASRPRRVAAITAALAGLLGGALAAHRRLADSLGGSRLLVEGGILYVFESAAAARDFAPEYALIRRQGIRAEPLTGAAARALEPALADGLHSALFFPDNGHVLDPFALVTRIAAQVEAQGGRLVETAAEDVLLGPRGARAVLTAAGRFPADLVVLAAGALSGPLATRLGADLPLTTQRGYHMTLPRAGVSLGRALVSGDRHFCLTPMTGGLRLAGTVELARFDRPPDWRRAEALVTVARRLLPGLDGRDGSPWMGHRPALPDSLPVIDRAPAAHNVLLALGHGHLGLTLGPVTGDVIADLARDQAPAFDLRPFAATRFRRRAGLDLTAAAV